MKTMYCPQCGYQMKLVELQPHGTAVDLKDADDTMLRVSRKLLDVYIRQIAKGRKFKKAKKELLKEIKVSRRLAEYASDSQGEKKIYDLSKIFIKKDSDQELVVLEERYTRFAGFEVGRLELAFSDFSSDELNNLARKIGVDVFKNITEDDLLQFDSIKSSNDARKWLDGHQIEYRLIIKNALENAILNKELKTYPDGWMIP